ncbi:MAG: hypothetical protein Q8J74_07535 [Candidatus Didemnitutus sp.]|nr:hypothetical protein [Candidatus Didemnitutus sp.]
MVRCVAVILLLCGLAGCAKPPLPDLIVRAASSEDLASFRAELGTRFPAVELEPFDTALNELRLDAMHRNVATVAARELDMLAAVNGGTVHAAQILGWQARRARFVRETALFADMLAHDLKAQQESATGVSQTVTNRIQNSQDILARLARDLAETDQRLVAWGAPPAPAAPSVRQIP